MKTNFKNQPEYQTTQSHYKKWFEEKEVPLDNLEEGLAVDLRDKDYYWLPAKITKIEDHKHITFKYIKNGNSHQEVLPIYSERIAKENSILGLKEIRKI